MEIFAFILGVSILFLLLLRHLPEVAEESAVETHQNIFSGISRIEKRVGSSILGLKDRFMHKSQAGVAVAEKRKFSINFKMPKMPSFAPKNKEETQEETDSELEFDDSTKV